jgi:hypothetical protein
MNHGLGKLEVVSWKKLKGRRSRECQSRATQAKGKDPKDPRSKIPKTMSTCMMEGEMMH